MVLLGRRWNKVGVGLLALVQTAQRSQLLLSRPGAMVKVQRWQLVVAAWRQGGCGQDRPFDSASLILF